MAGAHVLPAIDRTVLDAPLQRALRGESVEITDWDLATLRHSNNPTAAGLYRVTGHAGRDDGVVPWSMVLKVIHAAEVVPLPFLRPKAVGRPSMLTRLCSSI